MRQPDVGRRTLLAATATAALCTLSGCQAPEHLVRVASNRWVGYSPLFLARDLGHLNNGNLRVLEQPSSTASLMALASGQVEAAALTLDEVLATREGGLDLQVLWVFDESAGADVVVARPSLTQIQQLRGHRVAVENTATGALMLVRTLAEAGLAPSDVIKVPLAGNQQVQAYEVGEVDAVVCFEPYATLLTNLGAKRLIDSRQFPGLIVDVMVARPASLQTSPRQFAQLAAGYFQALSMMRHSPSMAYRMLAPTLGISEPELEAALHGVEMKSLGDNHALLQGAAPRFLGTAQTLAELMLKAGLLTAPARLTDLVAPQFLPAN